MSSSGMALLPHKFTPSDRSALHLGAEIAGMLADGPLPLGEIGVKLNASPRRLLGYDVVAGTVSMLFAMGIVQAEGDMIHRVSGVGENG